MLQHLKALCILSECSTSSQCHCQLHNQHHAMLDVVCNIMTC